MNNSVTKYILKWKEEDVHSGGTKKDRYAGYMCSWVNFDEAIIYNTEISALTAINGNRYLKNCEVCELIMYVKD